MVLKNNNLLVSANHKKIILNILAVGELVGRASSCQNEVLANHELGRGTALFFWLITSGN